MSKIIISPKKENRVSEQAFGTSAPAVIHLAAPHARRFPSWNASLLAEAGITYIEAHDVEIPSSDVPEAKELMKQYGLKMGMYTPSFFADPIFKDGAMTSNDKAVRKQALINAKEAVDVTVELGSEIMVFWNGREGFDFMLAKNGQESFRRMVEGFNAVGHYALEKYGKKSPRFALEPKPNEPRANMYLSNVGEVLYLISRLDPRCNHCLG